MQAAHRAEGQIKASGAADCLVNYELTRNRKAVAQAHRQA